MRPTPSRPQGVHANTLLGWLPFWRATPIRVCPFPSGKDFAVTFVDDTDLSTRDNTAPVYEFLHSQGILGTKTVWVNRQRRTSSYRQDQEQPVGPDMFGGSTLEDDDYRKFVRELADDGYEIALHGVAAGNSYRDEIVQGLEKFKALFGIYPHINVFHERNIENLYAGYHKLDLWPLKCLERLSHNSDYQGHLEGSPYFWGDLAREKITYMRLPFHTIQKVNMLRWNPSMPFHDPRRPYVNFWFSSADGADCRRYVRLLSKANIDKLERERGACIVYTHFAKQFLVNRNGQLQLNPEFVDVTRYLGAHRNGWFPTASKLLDRLRICQQITVRHEAREVIVSNTGSETVADLSLYANPSTVLKDDNGTEYRALPNGVIGIDALPGLTSMRFVSNQRYWPRRPIGNHRGHPRWERMRLEVLNYLGMLGD